MNKVTPKSFDIAGMLRFEIICCGLLLADIARRTAVKRDSLDVSLQTGCSAGRTIDDSLSLKKRIESLHNVEVSLE
jgi:hypothetical protein